MASTSEEGGGAPQSSSSSLPADVQEFDIRVPKNTRKKHHVMRFNATLDVDFLTWHNVKLERENKKKVRGIKKEEDISEDQSWILKIGGKDGKKFKGIREKGVGENSAFYVFSYASDGLIEAYPLNEWYNFQPIDRFKPLTAEEAEHEFGRRQKVLNYFSLMLRKRSKGQVAEEEDDEEEEEEEEEERHDTGKVEMRKGDLMKTELKISEMGEWIDSDKKSDSNKKEIKKKKEEESDYDFKVEEIKDKGKMQSDEKANVNNEAFKESNDRYKVSRKMDYDTESSEDESDPESKLKKHIKSIAKQYVRELLNSYKYDVEDMSSDDSSTDENGKRQKIKRQKVKRQKVKNKKKISEDRKKKKTKAKYYKKETSSEFSSDSSESEDDKKRLKRKAKYTKKNVDNSRSVKPTTNKKANKRKLNSMTRDLNDLENSDSPLKSSTKRSKSNPAPSLPLKCEDVATGSKDDEITEGATRRYLMQEEKTGPELLEKSKKKKKNDASNNRLKMLTQILKRIKNTSK